MKRLAMCLVLAGTMACGNKKEKEAPPAPPPPAPAAPADAAQGSAAPAPPPAAAVDVPATTDFEDQAAKDITDKNVEAKVKELETDLGH